MLLGTDTAALLSVHVCPCVFHVARKAVAQGLRYGFISVGYIIITCCGFTFQFWSQRPIWKKLFQLSLGLPQHSGGSMVSSCRCADLSWSLCPQRAVSLLWADAPYSYSGTIRDMAAAAGKVCMRVENCWGQSLPPHKVTLWAFIILNRLFLRPRGTG